MAAHALPQNGNARYDRRLAEILAHATEVFCEKGYDAASIRDISRASGTSLAGLYYYFKSKEQLLYLIQKDAFETLMARLGERFSAADGALDRLRAVMDNHLAYFLEQPQRMKVLSRESDTLKGPHHAEIAGLKRRYYRMCLGVMEEVRKSHGLERLNPRLAVMSMFGMMNWIYTWHNPQIDPAAAALSKQMAAIFLEGILNKENHNERKRIRRGRKTTGQLPRGEGRSGPRNGRSARQHLHP